ncbi:DUF2061 domain-containing protein [Methylobacterium sp. P5_C11]
MTGRAAARLSRMDLREAACTPTICQPIAAPSPGNSRPPPGEYRVRSIAKAVSLRVVGSLDTLLSYLFTGTVLIAGSIASTETATKTLLY